MNQMLREKYEGQVREGKKRLSSAMETLSHVSDQDRVTRRKLMLVKQAFTGRPLQLKRRKVLLRY